MFFSKKEEKVLKKFFEYINEFPNEVYILEFQGGLIVEAKLDTCYETDNGLDEDEDGFEEYYACAMYVEKVISLDKEKKVEKGQLLEINYRNCPVIKRQVWEEIKD